MNMMSNTAPSALSILEEDALALTQTALEISRAFESKDEKRLAAALDPPFKFCGAKDLRNAKWCQHQDYRSLDQH